MKTFFQFLIAAAVLVALGFFAGRHTVPPCRVIIEARTDTVTIRDTIRERVPVPVDRVIVRVDTIPVAVPGDTVHIDALIPIERKTYQTVDYRAVVEGFRPALVSLDIYRQTRFIDRVQTIRTPDRRRWALALQAGYGLTPKGPQPYLGIGMQYNIARW
jgi:hypothetical protein